MGRPGDGEALGGPPMPRGPKVVRMSCAISYVFRGGIVAADAFLITDEMLDLGCDLDCLRCDDAGAAAASSDERGPL